MSAFVCGCVVRNWQEGERKRKKRKQEGERRKEGFFLHFFLFLCPIVGCGLTQKKQNPVPLNCPYTPSCLSVEHTHSDKQMHIRVHLQTYTNGHVSVNQTCFTPLNFLVIKYSLPFSFSLPLSLRCSAYLPNHKIWGDVFYSFSLSLCLPPSLPFSQSWLMSVMRMRLTWEVSGKLA